MGGGPVEGRPGVVVGDGDAVLRGAAVVDGEDNNRGGGSEGVEVGVEDGGGGGEDAEATATEVEDERELAATIAAVGRKIDAGGDDGGDGDVLGFDACAGVEGRWGVLLRPKALDGAVLVDAEVRRVVVDDGVGVGRDSREGSHCGNLANRARTADHPLDINTNFRD